MSDSKENVINKLVLTLGIITSLTGIASNLIQIFNSEYSKVLLIIGITLVLLYFLIRQLCKSKGILKYIILTLIFSLTAGTLFLSFYFCGLLLNNKKCLFQENLISIGISKFNESSDNFSLLVYEFWLYLVLMLVD